MAEGNRRVAESLRQGREKFEAGDFTAAREAFLQVLAVDETDATARSYIDRIEQELARPSAGLDLSRKAPAGDILAEEMAEAAAPDFDLEPEPIEDKIERRRGPRSLRRPRAALLDKRFVFALGGRARPGDRRRSVLPAPGRRRLRAAGGRGRRGRRSSTRPSSSGKGRFPRPSRN